MSDYVQGQIPDGGLPALRAFLAEEFARIGNTLLAPAVRAPTLKNGWVNFGLSSGFEMVEAGFYKDVSGIVHIEGLIKNGTTTIGTGLFNLPPGFRPSRIMPFAVLTNDVLGHVNVSPFGSVACVANISATWLCLNGISFLAAA